MPRRITVLLFLLAGSVTAQLPASASASQKEQPFAGTQITVVVQDAPAIGGPADRHAATWERRTGGRVKVIKYPFGKLFKAIESDLKQRHSFDVLLYASSWVGDFYPFIAPLPEALSDSESFDDIHSTYRERLMKWADEWVAVTLDGDLFNGYYRKDLFEDAANRAVFRETYGYELKAPDTWRQYRDIAEFFNGRKDAAGRRLYGSAEAFRRGGQQFWDFFSRASAYTNHPEHPGAQFFDPDSMRAQINNPGWVTALEDYLEILRFAPPKAREFDIIEARNSFIVRAESAMALDWGDTGQIAADQADSRIKDKVGYFVLPGSHEVWNYKSRRWDHFELPHKAPFLAFGGWVASVAKDSPRQAAAWDFIMWYGSPENSMRDVTTSGSGVNPYRYTHLLNIDAWTRAFSKRGATEYLGMLQASLDSPYAALDLRIPGFYEYTEALETELDRVLDGSIEPAAALDRVAARWEKITDRHGRDQQRAIYRAAMGLDSK